MIWTEINHPPIAINHFLSLVHSRFFLSGWRKMLLTLQSSADVTMSFPRIVGHCYAFRGCSHPLAIVQCSAIHLPAMFITKIVCKIYYCTYKKADSDDIIAALWKAFSHKQYWVDRRPLHARMPIINKLSATCFLLQKNWLLEYEHRNTQHRPHTLL